MITSSSNLIRWFIQRNLVSAGAGAGCEYDDAYDADPLRNRPGVEKPRRPTVADHFGERGNRDHDFRLCLRCRAVCGDHNCDNTHDGSGSRIDQRVRICFLRIAGVAD